MWCKWHIFTFLLTVWLFYYSVQLCVLSEWLLNAKNFNVYLKQQSRLSRLSTVFLPLLCAVCWHHKWYCLLASKAFLSWWPGIPDICYREAAGSVMLTMWIILRRLGNSRHALIIMLCISAVCLNWELQQPNAFIVLVFFCDAVRKKKIHFFSNGMKRFHWSADWECTAVACGARPKIQCPRKCPGSAVSFQKQTGVLHWSWAAS